MKNRRAFSIAGVKLNIYLKKRTELKWNSPLRSSKKNTKWLTERHSAPSPINMNQTK